MVFSDCDFLTGVLQRRSIWTFFLTCISEIQFGTTFKIWFWRLTLNVTSEIWSLQLFSKSFRYQTSRYCMSLIRLFWDWGVPLLKPYPYQLIYRWGFLYFKVPEMLDELWGEEAILQSSPRSWRTSIIIWNLRVPTPMPTPPRNEGLIQELLNTIIVP